jgi:hypothetical protein
MIQIVKLVNKKEKNPKQNKTKQKQKNQTNQIIPLRNRPCFGCGTSLYWLTPFELGYSAFLSRCMVIHVGR